MGKFSWQYTFAAGLLDGKVNMATFQDARRFAPDMEAMLGKISLDMRAEIPGSATGGVYEGKTALEIAEAKGKAEVAALLRE